MILSKNFKRSNSCGIGETGWRAGQVRHKNGAIDADCVKRILAKEGANTSYSRLTIMYYRRAQPTTRGLENGYEESDEDVEESSGEEGCEEDRSEEGAGEEDGGEEARQEGSEEEVSFALSVATGDATQDPSRFVASPAQHRAPSQQDFSGAHHRDSRR
jgi:cobalamin biosynthesis protein CobT